MINKNQECAVVSDLLPLYMEQKTGKECNEFIRRHLEGCENCRKALAYMEASYEELLQDSGQTDAETGNENTGTVKTEVKSRFKNSRRSKFKIFVCGYLMLLVCIWLYLIFGLFWGVM